MGINLKKRNEERKAAQMASKAKQEAEEKQRQAEAGTVQAGNVDQHAIVPTDPDANLPMGQFDNETGYDDFDPSDFIVPRIRIVQPTSKAGTPGNFFSTLSEEEAPEFEAVFLSARKGRILWDNELDQPDPVCKSDDFFNPSREIEDPVSAQCAERFRKAGRMITRELCQACKWSPDGDRPDCSATITILGITTDELNPFFITFTGTSLRPVKKLIQIIAMKKKKLHDFKTMLSLVKTEGKKGIYYVVKFSKAEALDDDELAELAELIPVYKDQASSAPVEREDTDAGMGDI